MWGRGRMRKRRMRKRGMRGRKKMRKRRRRGHHKLSTELLPTWWVWPHCAWMTIQLSIFENCVYEPLHFRQLVLCRKRENVLVEGKRG